MGCVTFLSEHSLAQSKEQIAAERKERKIKTVANVKKRAKKRRNYWDIAMRYKDYGVGLMFRRSIWPPENQTFWTITRVRMRTMVRSFAVAGTLQRALLRCS